MKIRCGNCGEIICIDGCGNMPYVYCTECGERLKLTSEIRQEIREKESQNQRVSYKANYVKGDRDFR